MQILTKISSHFFSIFTDFGVLTVACAFASIDMTQKVPLYSSFFFLSNYAITQ